MDTCPECGADLGGRSCCDDLFHEVLAWEWLDPPRTGQYHHLLVTCWELQHPSRFSDELLAIQREALIVILRDDIPHEQLRAERRGVFDQNKRDFRMLRKGGQPVLRQWTRTLSDVVAEGSEAMPGSIKRWAEAVAVDLDGGS